MKLNWDTWFTDNCDSSLSNCLYWLSACHYPKITATVCCQKEYG